MWIRIVGCFIIVALSWIIGYLFSKSYSDRVDELKDLYKLFNTIYNQISYALIPITDVIHSTKENMDYPIRNFLNDFEANISSGERDIRAAWNEALNTNYSKLCLKKEDLNILKWFGAELGHSDKRTQLRNIELTMNQLQQNTKDAEIKKEKNCKLYRSLGISVGFFLAILLI